MDEGAADPLFAIVALTRYRVPLLCCSQAFRLPSSSTVHNCRTDTLSRAIALLLTGLPVRFFRHRRRSPPPHRRRSAPAPSCEIVSTGFAGRAGRFQAASRLKTFRRQGVLARGTCPPCRAATLSTPCAARARRLAFGHGFIKGAGGVSPPPPPSRRAHSRQSCDPRRAGNLQTLPSAPEYASGAP